MIYGCLEGECEGLQQKIKVKPQNKVNMGEIRFYLFEALTMVEDGCTLFERESFSLEVLGEVFGKKMSVFRFRERERGCVFRLRG